MKIILYILLMLSSSIFAQSKLDSLILNEVNLYRDSIGLNKLEYDKECFNISYIHSNRLILEKDKVYHSDNFIKAEVVNRMENNYKKNDLYVEIKIAKQVVSCWKNSKDHNDILLNNDLKSFGGSTIIKKSGTGTNRWVHYIIVSTLNFK